MDHTRAGQITVEPDNPQGGTGVHTPVLEIGGGNAAGVEDPAAKRLIPKINREQAAIIRLLKGSLRAMLRTGAALAEAQGVLGSAFPNWVQTRLPLTVTEADFLVRLSVAKSKIDEKELSPTREVKLARLAELLEELADVWHSNDPADKRLLEVARPGQPAN